MDNAKSSFLRKIGPGILVAATGVGAGDLATAALKRQKHQPGLKPCPTGPQKFAKHRSSHHRNTELYSTPDPQAI